MTKPNARGKFRGCRCADCGRPYGDKHGFPDLIIPFSVWKRITPTKDAGGLLCPSCICKRLADAGIQCEGAFMSGPITSVSGPTMEALRRVENIELAIDGRDNRWADVRKLVHREPGDRPMGAAPLSPREWLCQGGGGHEDGEDGIRAGTVSMEHAIELIESYTEYLAGDAKR